MRTKREPLEPITITITDQRELRRIHRVAKWERRKPAHSARVALRGGTWDTLHAQQEIDKAKA
ncbi:MAG: hypothetical protein V4689_11770 [Verrucomicrobiota bacterium]